MREDLVLSEAEVEESRRHLLKATLASLASASMTPAEAADSVRGVCAGMLASSASAIPAVLRADLWAVLLELDLKRRTTLLCDVARDSPTTLLAVDAGKDVLTHRQHAHARTHT